MFILKSSYTYFVIFLFRNLFIHLFICLFILDVSNFYPSASMIIILFQLSLCFYFIPIISLFLFYSNYLFVLFYSRRAVLIVVLSPVQKAAFITSVITISLVGVTVTAQPRCTVRTLPLMVWTSTIIIIIILMRAMTGGWEPLEEKVKVSIIYRMVSILWLVASVSTHVLVYCKNSIFIGKGRKGKWLGYHCNFYWRDCYY